MCFDKQDILRRWKAFYSMIGYDQQYVTTCNILASFGGRKSHAFGTSIFHKICNMSFGLVTIVIKGVAQF